MVTLMQNEGKTNNKKTMITFSSNDFSVPSSDIDFSKFLDQFLSKSIERTKIDLIDNRW